ncbi:hypothetical protein SHPE106448_21220 [Shewanella pealeana]
MQLIMANVRYLQYQSHCKYVVGVGCMFTWLLVLFSMFVCEYVEGKVNERRLIYLGVF